MPSLHRFRGAGSDVHACAQGYFDCKFWLDEGFEYDVQDVASLAESGEQLKTYQSKQAVGWSVSKADVPSPSDRFTKSYSEVAYTLWVRLMKKLSQFRAASTAWVKPQPLPFFSDNREEWLDSFQDFDMVDRLQFDDTVRSKTQSCKDGNPTIEYYQCSSRYNRLYFDAAQNFQKYVRKRAAPIIRPGAALVWPGLSLQHHMGHSVPAWSKTGRSLRQTFAKWLFDTSTQCNSGSPDTSVCALDPSDPNMKQMLAVIPWLAGDYNPW